MLYTVTTEDFETVAVRVSAQVAAALAGTSVGAILDQVAAYGAAAVGRFIIEPAFVKTRRDGWVSEFAFDGMGA